MTRWLILPALAMLLAGCVADSGYRSSYDDGYYVGSRYGEPVYAGGSSYYAPSYDGRGDYYYAEPGYSNYVDNPYYYSLFWGLNRWSVDPYWHPGFFYGVTYYPRSYFSLGFGSSYGFRHGFGYGFGYGGAYRPWGYGSYSYSPYRLSWVDSYYDWPSYRNTHSRRSYSHYAPRYGNARHEANWLSRQSRVDSRYGNDPRRYGNTASGLPRTQLNRSADRSRDALDARRDAARGADYGRSTRDRADPAVSGFGYRNEVQVRRPSELRDPIGRARGDSESRGEPSRYRAGPAGQGYTRDAYIGESGDIRSGSRGTVRSRDPAQFNRPTSRSGAVGYAEPRGQRSAAPDVRGGYQPDASGNEAQSRGYRIAPSSTSRPTYRTQSEPTPMYRDAEPRYRQQRDSNPQSSPVGRGYAPASGQPAPVYRQPESRSISPSQYRSAQPQRQEVPRQDVAPRQSYAPREQPARAAEPRAAPAPARSESGRSGARSERSGRRGGDPEYEPR